MQELIRRFRNGEQRALARVITILENESTGAEEIMKELYPLTGRAYILGLTGSPGAGKSSLVDRLTSQLRKQGQTVGVIAVDPTSPFSGGALLGDRIRMQNHAVDRGVFIRSMGTRGSLGGLAHTTGEVIKAMDAFGFNWIIIETVGVGQAEIDIMHVADTTVVVLTPGAGDAIQTIKAGIMEIADIFAVNKCDLPGAARVASEVEIMLDMQAGQLDWRPPVVSTSTLNDRGTADLLAAIDQHHQHLQAGGLFARRRKTRTKDETLSLINHRWQQLVQKQINQPGRVNELISAVINKETDPYTAAAKIFARLTGNQDKS